MSNKRKYRNVRTGERYDEIPENMRLATQEEIDEYNRTGTIADEGENEENYSTPGLVVVGIPQKTPLDKLLDDAISSIKRFNYEFSENDPIFGRKRRVLVDRYYGADNPFRQGADDAANLVTTVAMAPGIGNGLGNVVNYAVTNGVKSIFPIATAIAGGAAGAQLWNTGYEAVTGHDYNEDLANMGVNGLNRTLMNPGGYLGSYAGGYMGDAVLNNGYATLSGTQPATVMTSQGPVTLQPGETITFNGRPITYQQAGQGNFGYQRGYTTPKGVRGSASGQSNRVQSNAGTSGRTSSNAVQSRTMRDTRSGKGKVSETYSNTPVPFVAPTWNGYMPWFGYVPVEPPVTPPVTPPATPPVEPENRVVETTEVRDPFAKWFSRQKEGTVQYYEGDVNHGPGWYYIIWGGNVGETPWTQRRVGTYPEGRVVPDSSRVSPGATENSVTVIPGGVDPNATVSETEFIRGFGPVDNSNRYK